MSDCFAILGLPRVFALDPVAIQRAFLTRSAEIHAGVADADEQDRALSELNQAKAIVENPESRADALVLLAGGPSRETDRSLPEGFLQEMMELRQAMEEEIESASTEARPAAIAKWEGWSFKRRQDHERRAGLHFAQLHANVSPMPGVSEPPSENNLLRTIRRELNAWRYIERMIEQIDPQQGPGL